MQDGTPIVRGRSREEADKIAQPMAVKLKQRQAGTTVHLPHIEVVRDVQAMKQRDHLYTEFKGYRNGWNSRKQQRQALPSAS